MQSLSAGRPAAETDGSVPSKSEWKEPLQVPAKSELAPGDQVQMAYADTRLEHGCSALAPVAGDRVVVRRAAMMAGTCRMDRQHKSSNIGSSQLRVPG
jgi:hypothetical protein